MVSKTARDACRAPMKLERMLLDILYAAESNVEKENRRTLNFTEPLLRKTRRLSMYPDHKLELL